MFGSTQQANASTASASASPFGGGGDSSPFGAATGSPFGAAASASGGDVFGNGGGAGVNMFGSSTPSTPAPAPAAFAFGSSSPSTTPASTAFGGAATSPFAAAHNANGEAMSIEELFFSNAFGNFSQGQQQQQQQQQQQHATPAANSNVFGSTSTPVANDMFGTNANSAQSDIFGAASSSSTPAANVFGGANANAASQNMFGGTPTAAPSNTGSASANIFGCAGATDVNTANVFGAPAPAPSGGAAANIFGAPAPATAPSNGIFGAPAPAPGFAQPPQQQLQQQQQQQQQAVAFGASTAPKATMAAPFSATSGQNAATTAAAKAAAAAKAMEEDDGDGDHDGAAAEQEASSNRWSKIQAAFAGSKATEGLEGAVNIAPSGAGAQSVPQAFRSSSPTPSSLRLLKRPMRPVPLSRLVHQQNSGAQTGPRSSLLTQRNKSLLMLQDGSSGSSQAGKEPLRWGDDSVKRVVPKNNVLGEPAPDAEENDELPRAGSQELQAIAPSRRSALGDRNNDNDHALVVVPKSGTKLRLCPTTRHLKTIPSLSELQNYSAKQLMAVRDFGVKCAGVGEVTWPGLTDVRHLDLDEAIQFSKDAKGRAKVSFYSSQKSSDSGHNNENDNENDHVNASSNSEFGRSSQRLKKLPQVGEGLNKDCVITLIGFKPTSDRRARKMQKRIAQATDAIGGELIDYDSHTGAWTFALQKIC